MAEPNNPHLLVQSLFQGLLPARKNDAHKGMFGTRDEFNGTIGSLMASGLSWLEAAKLGVYVHGAVAGALITGDIGPV